MLSELHEQLSRRVVTVTFIKVNGDTRVMKCTKNFELIPSDKYPQQEAMPKTVNESIERVFDVEILDWRSFRKDSVTSWE